MQAGNNEEAESNFSRVLKQEPANRLALEGCAETASLLGQTTQAEAYRQLLNALGGNEPTQNTGQDKPGSIAKIETTTTSEKDNDLVPPETKLRMVETTDNLTIGPWEDHEPVVTLADVGGMESVKKRLDMAFLAPLKNPELVKLYKKTLNGGLMLYGPPGCGKTFIARALAGELGAKFMSIGLSDVLDMWLGESERKLHEMFELARRNAPTVLFIDEIDALGQKRSQQRHSAGRNIVNQLLSELDSLGSDNKNLFVLSATNHPWDVDAALKRPGRFDRTILVLPPDRAARQQILSYHLTDRPTENLDLERIAEYTERFSGADLAHLCESAVESALEDSINSGSARPVQQSDFENSVILVKPSTGPWFETAKNYAMFANEGGIYDDLLGYVQKNKI
jgi:SpoVK/Ycf46/Vps4 family AAA+-type ATPase